MSKKQQVLKDMADSVAILRVLKVALDHEGAGAATTTLEVVLSMLGRVQEGIE